MVAPVPVRPPAELRLAELMAALSLATDLGNGHPLEKALRDAVLAVGLAKELGLDGQDLSDVYYLALLEHLRCTAGSHELAAGFGGDDNGVGPVAHMVEQARPHEAMAAYGEPHRGRGTASMATILLRSILSGNRFRLEQNAAVCEASDRLASRLGVSSGVRDGLQHGPYAVGSQGPTPVG